MTSQTARKAWADKHGASSKDVARRQVRAQLKADPAIKRAFVTRFEPDSTLIVTLGSRGIGTGELKTPAERFNQRSLDDYASLLAYFEGAA